MRILLINTSERLGGPAVACSRLMESLKNNGIKAKMLVRYKQTDQLSVVKLEYDLKRIWFAISEKLLGWINYFFRKNNRLQVDIAAIGSDITSLPEFKQADVIHLHWINQGMLSLQNLNKILKSGKPIVWTMHDMWPFTGICYYSQGCNHHQTQCHNCQFLHRGGGKHDLSSLVFNKKKSLYENTHITFVACSKWLEEEAAASKLLKGHTITSIPNPINTSLFRPGNKKEARERFSLPQDKKLLLFGALKITDKRKGLEYFAESCHILARKYPEMKDTVGVVVFGTQSDLVQKLIPFAVYPQDYVKDERELVNIYNAVDLFVLPSLGDNLPNTVMEAMACGIPCVGFDVGGIPEMIDHLHNGYVAEYKSSEDFANGIHWMLTEGEYPSLSEEATRKVVSHYTESVIAKKYINIYNKITGSND